MTGDGCVVFIRDKRIVPLSFIDGYIGIVRQISKEMGCKENEFINSSQEVHSEYEKVKSEGRNISADVDVVPDRKGTGSSDSIRTNHGGRGGGENIGKSRDSELLAVGLSDEEIETDGDRISKRVNGSAQSRPLGDVHFLALFF